MGTSTNIRQMEAIQVLALRGLLSLVELAQVELNLS
jgi:hypothetical protein